jgi:hypothetical protein
VKELRAALRGRYFRILFPLTLLVATAVAVLLLIDDLEWPDRAGRDLFNGVFTCLMLAVNGLVPFSAFLAMGNEWDEHTYDLLVLSRLKPRQIVLGKLLAVGVEGLLYFSAFTPFIVFSFLLHGVDIASIVVLLVGAGLCSASCSAIGLALSSLSRVRIVRVFLMVLLAGILTAANVAALAFSYQYVRHPGNFARAEDVIVLLITYSIVAVPGVLASSAAASTISHAEENASSGPRAVITGLLVFVLALAIWGQAVSPDSYAPMVAGTIGTLFCSLCAIIFATEPERFSRRMRGLVPRTRARAWSATPFLPGGGRGLILLVLQFALILVCVGVMVALGPSGSSTLYAPGHSLLSILGLQSYFLAYVALPSTLVAGRSGRARTRLLTRALIPVGALVSIFLPALVGFLVGQRSWMEMRHAFNPFWMAFDATSSDARTLYILLGLGVLACCLPRMLRSVHEVEEARWALEQPHDA